MDLGQITQGLRPDILAQASAQGINVSQLMESGVSFADIMLMIVQNQQGLTEASGIEGTTEMPPMAGFQDSAEMPQEFMQGLMENSANSLHTLNIQNYSSVDSDNLFVMKQNKSQFVLSEGMQKPVEMPQIEGMEKPVEMPQTEGLQKPVEMLQTEAVQKPVEMPQTESVQKPVEMPQTEAVQKPAEMPQTEAVQKPVEMPQTEAVQKPVEMLQIENVQKPVEVLQTENVHKPVEMPKAENTMEVAKELHIDNVLQNVNTLISDNSDLRQINRDSSVNTFDYYRQMQNISDLQVADNISQTNLRNLMEFISPEIMKVAENTSSSDGNSFVIDLLSGLSSEQEVKDSFDFSESMLKVDPLQLAGLLEFVGTGNGIPLVSDISGNEIFKNIENISDAGKQTGKITFDPQEMIKSGEMEIVSYVPAEKNAQNAQSELLRQNHQSAEKSIDFARTMKSVKENVSSEIPDETTDFSQITASMTTVNPDELAHKVDISFERAYAELEMNKAKYGAPDQQLSKGIYENLEKGKSEFTVKLRPEGLGEILVKLVSEEGGKAVLSMVASSEKTAELLNRDLAALQTSLNQHNVEIENSSVKTAETVMHAQTAFDQYDERRQEEANQQHHFRQLKNKLGNVSDINASFEAETQPVNNIVSDSALNITI